VSARLTRPRMQKLVADYLRAVEPVADIIGRRVVAKTPDTTAEPWVRLTQLAAPQTPGSPVDYLVAYYFQLDCYAGKDGGEPEAETLQAAVCDALVAIADTEHDGAQVTAGRVESAHSRPDTDFTPARERFIVTATVHATGIEA
jgi:hypothetical protein